MQVRKTTLSFLLVCALLSLSFDSHAVSRETLKYHAKKAGFVMMNLGGLSLWSLIIRQPTTIDWHDPSNAVFGVVSMGGLFIASSALIVTGCYCFSQVKRTGRSYPGWMIPVQVPFLWPDQSGLNTGDDHSSEGLSVQGESRCSSLSLESKEDDWRLPTSSDVIHTTWYLDGPDGEQQEFHESQYPDVV